MPNSPIIYGPNSAINLHPSGGELDQATGRYRLDNGPKNYITYNSIENNATTGWTLGVTGALTNGLPTTTPTFGSGAAGTLALAVVSTNQLAGLYSLSYADSAAATTVGNMVASSALTIDKEDQAKVLTFKFSYIAQAGAATANFSGTSSNSFGVAIWDVTNSVWLTSTGNFNLIQSSGVGICTGTCQTNATTASVRFVIYNANATTAAVTMYFDSFFLGPQIAQAGVAMSDWVAYTPTFVGFGTVASSNIKSRRVGDSLEVRGTFTAGTPTAVTASMTLGYNGANGNVTADTAKVPVSNILGIMSQNASTTTYFGQYILAPASNLTTVAFSVQSSGSNAQTAALGNSILAAGGVGEFSFTVPIVGWSSNSLMSSDSLQQIVAARITGLNGVTTTTTGGVIKYFTTQFDTTGSYSAATGLYTCPVSGYYRVTNYANISSAAASASFTYLGINNNTAVARLVSAVQTSGGSAASAVVKCNAGDTLGIYSAINTITFNDGDAFAYAIFERLTGPAVISATESVNARYFASATSISGSLATIVWTTKDFDSHNGMSSGVYTIPVSGKYQINTAVATAGTFALNNQVVIEIQKNSSVVSRTKNYAGGVVTALSAEISDTISCLAGDTVRVQVSSGATTPTIVSSNFENFFSIERVGN